MFKIMLCQVAFAASLICRVHSQPFDLPHAPVIAVPAGRSAPRVAVWLDSADKYNLELRNMARVNEDHETARSAPDRNLHAASYDRSGSTCAIAQGDPHSIVFAPPLTADLAPGVDFGRVGPPAAASSTDSIEEVIARLPAGDHRTVYLRTGVYRLQRSLVLTGTAGSVTIAACPGEKPVLHGGSDAPAIILRGVHGAALIGLTFADPSAVQILLAQAYDCVVAGNTFLRAGTAILLDGASRNRVQRNLVLQAAETGIELRDGSDANLVADNVVDGAAAPETHGGGIFLHGVSNNRIAHNFVQGTAGFGIGVSNWDEATVNIANVVEYNLLRNTALTAEDSGAIYILGRSGLDTETVIAGNVVDGVGAPGQHDVGIYLDDSTSGAVVTGNLVRRVASDAVQIHGGSDNVIDNNLFDLGLGRPSAVLFQAAPADTHPLNLQSGNQVLRNVILSANRDPKLFVWYDGGSPAIAGNFYANATGAALVQVAPVIDNAPALGDPAVAAEGAAGRYAAAQIAAARAIGFAAIDLTIAGPRSQ